MSEEYIERRMHELRKLGKDHADAKKNILISLQMQLVKRPS